jgi:hypothetical protein
MAWLSKFEHYNCCTKAGTYGWFMHAKDEPLNGWFQVDRDIGDVSDDRHKDFHDYKKSDVNFFMVTETDLEHDEKHKMIESGRCTLNGKKYFYNEFIMVVK